MSLTVAEIDAAISRILLNGETWEMGDIKSHTALEKLVDLRDQELQRSAAGGVSYDVVQFQSVKSEGT